MEPVDIEEHGTFKYVLVRVTNPKTGESDTLVRGYADCEYHQDVLDRVTPEAMAHGFDCEQQGGGRIEVDKDEGSILVYGYSVAFGRANHQTTVDILKQRFPEYTITFSNEGY
ncbi:hypothetical protein PTSG_10862 [Salpingoeca rosetta]|uniref:14 kDa phosphohistidine phosphatase n=1 Tax=Salpingoeca rosetta (strain ATCC 50818 / BSB-021) TaxID=946362 RepID=F2UR78_SALR5|nr:uncharacterized protein PTSG_10862 [Salpingoeca rosetta]EGD80181.1 hypothetical protein PTSG_10862 [Salpingoeca rosetta]|eukprot:XP_004988243.1 hypothetical protein PTSG_10862 [Salpingoeca rosetta]